MSELALRLVDTSSDEFRRLDALSDSVRVLHALPGRVRYHLPLWDGSRAAELESALVGVPGVVDVEASPVTRNLLVYFDLNETTEPEIRRALESLARGAQPVDRLAAERRRPPRVASRALSRTTAAPATRSERRLEILLGRRAAKLLPYVPKLLLLALSMFTTRTPVGITMLSLDWLDVLSRLNTALA